MMGNLFMVKVGAYSCLAWAIVMVVLAIIVPAAWWGLLIGAAALFGAAAVLLLVSRFREPKMPDLMDLPGLGGDKADTEVLLDRTGKAMNRVAKMSKLGSALARDREKYLRRTGIKAKAEVLAIHRPKRQESPDPILEFDLRIQPDKGKAYAVKKHRQQVPELVYPHITVGAIYEAFVDPHDRKILVIDWV